MLFSDEDLVALFVVVFAVVVVGWEGEGRVIFDDDGWRSWIFGAGGTDRMLEERLNVGRFMSGLSGSVS